jgi:hypothetical protein
VTLALSLATSADRCWQATIWSLVPFNYCLRV